MDVGAVHLPKLSFLTGAFDVDACSPMHSGHLGQLPRRNVHPSSKICEGPMKRCLHGWPKVPLEKGIGKESPQSRVFIIS